MPCVEGAYIAPTIGSLPPSCLWTISPRMPIMAARPLFSFMAHLDSLVSAFKKSHPKPMVPFWKSPGKSPGAVPLAESFITPSSRAPTNKTIWARPDPEMASGPLMVAQLLGKELKECPK